MNLRVLLEAKLEAAEAAIWYENQSFGLGRDFFDELDKAFEHIRSNSMALTSLETYAGQHDVRRGVLNRFPYLLIVVVRHHEAIVVAISHARQRPLYWIDRLGQV